MSIKIGLLGMGTVGTGVVQILTDPSGRHPLLQEIEIVRIGVRDATKPRSVGLDPQTFTTDLASIVNDPSIQIIVEVMGGLEPARELILQAIGNNKHIVTANKALLARHGEEIFELAKRHQVYVMLEASVGGGIPIVNVLKQFLGANRLTGILGIINGTTNYILSRMHQEGGNFSEILADAQRLGYAEADPTADIDGFDACDKIVILASIAFSERIPLSEVSREGIRHVSTTEIATASRLGYVIKLIARAQLVSQGIEIGVYPMLIPVEHPLAAIGGVTNAIAISGEPIGEVVFAGPGAGQGATASAVVADLINVCALLSSPGHPLLTCSHSGYAQVVAPRENKFYARFTTLDQPGVIGELGTIFGRYSVSLETVFQQNRSGDIAQVIVITHRVREIDFWQSVAKIKELPTLQEVGAILRVL
ncbi:MAG: homoserine dehydrogenase [Cyanobacteria bacterium KgW148]|nr:homoserine dehydrogenase [Cyanobacteria bacterium KgW148]